MKNKLFFDKRDIVIIGVCLILALVLWLPSLFQGGSLTAVITVDGEAYREIPLNAHSEEVIEIKGAAIEVSPEGVRFASSSCPDDVCVRTGLLSAPGDSAACVPLGIAVYIKGEKSEKELDAVAYRIGL